MSERVGNDRRVRVELWFDVTLPDTPESTVLDREVVAECVRAAAHRGVRSALPTWDTRIAELVC